MLSPVHFLITHLYVVLDSDIYILHEVHPIFIVLPALAGHPGLKTMLEQTLDEYDEKTKELNKGYVGGVAVNKLMLGSKGLKDSMGEICEVATIEGEEDMYKLSPEKLGKWLQAKVRWRRNWVV